MITDSPDTVLVVILLHCENPQMDGTIPGAISLCSSAFQQKWASEKESAFPFDDRQYFGPITAFLIEKTTYQANGIRMIKDAYSILALNEVRMKGLEMNMTTMGYFAEPTSFCDLGKIFLAPSFSFRAGYD